jgi:hypothetical protein
MGHAFSTFTIEKSATLMCLQYVSQIHLTYLIQQAVSPLETVMHGKKAIDKLSL